MQETQGRFLSWEDPLEQEMATHSSIFAGKNPMDRKIPGSPQGHRVWHYWATEHTYCAKNLLLTRNSHSGFLKEFNLCP